MEKCFTIDTLVADSCLVVMLEEPLERLRGNLYSLAARKARRKG